MAGLSIRNRNEGKFDKDGKRKTPNWEYRFDLAKIGGKRKQVSKSGFSTKAEATREGNNALAEYNNAGLYFDPTDVSVADYLDFWLANYCLLNVADSTYNAYYRIIEKHLKPRIGSYRLTSVTTDILQEMVNDIFVKEAFSKAFMKNILKVTNGAFKYACKTSKIIKYNPASDVELPKNQKKAKDIIILSKDDINKILARFDNDRSKYQYYAILTAYYTGLRVAEVYGLTWDCIDFEKKELTVNKNAIKIEREGCTSDGKRIRGVRGHSSTRWYYGSCKTDSSYRTIKIGDTLLTALREYKTWQEHNEKEYAEYYTKYYLKDELSPTNRNVKRLLPFAEMGVEIPLERTYPVFIKENGEFHGTDSMKYPSKVINFELGIKFNFHALRHTHATMLVEAGIPIKAISDRLGHGSVRTTLETYVHTTESMKNDTANTFENIGDLNNDKIVSIRDHKKNSCGQDVGKGNKKEVAN